jgi:sarcosine oxidase/L-pipecolate oxidase
MNNKLTVGGIFYDFKKAFNCVSHNILLSRLEFNGIVGKFNAFIKSYLKERCQGVLIYNRNTHNNPYSRWQKVKHGAPQGSILGPLFFLFYINDCLK